MTMQMSVPFDGRTHSSAGRAVRGWTRLFLIECRRSPAIFAAALIVVLTAWVMWNALPVGVVRWLQIGRSVRDAMVPVSAIAAGMAAYVAGRNERLGLGDQLGQTSLQQGWRDISSFLATMVWCVVGYLVIVLGFFSYAEMKATWGGPVWSFAYLSVATIIVAVALGWCIGSVFRHRQAPLSAFAVMLLLHGIYPVSSTLRAIRSGDPDSLWPGTIADAWYKNLFPYQMMDLFDVGAFTRLGALWLLMIASMFASVTWWWKYRESLSIVVLALSLVVGGIAAVGLTRNDLETQPHWSALPVDPVCTSRLDNRIEVCLHPADKSLLDESADAIARLVAPIVGIDDVPTRYTNHPASDIYHESDGVLFFVHDATDIPSLVYQTLHESLLVDVGSARGYHYGAAKYVMTLWLLQEAGVDSASVNLRPIALLYSGEVGIREGNTEPFDPSQRDHDAETDELAAFEREVYAALDRFSALSPEEQRAWLEANWDALRAGDLTLEDLP